MNEQDFRAALHRSMEGQETPPPMSDAPVLEAAHRDRKRRRAMFAGVGSAAAVVAIVVGVVALAPSGGNAAPVRVGGPAVTGTTNPAPDQATPTSGPANPSGDTKPQYPDGMTDRTARSGPHYDLGVDLAGALETVIPAGYDAPGDLSFEGLDMKRNQAQIADQIDGKDIWEYQAIAPITKGNGIGRLVVEVHTPGDHDTGDGCAMTPPFWGIAGSCTEIQVDGKPAAVVTVDSEQFDMWAAYRHADGSVVFVAQSADYPFAGMTALDGLPFTTDQLAHLAADPKFNID